MPVGMEHDFMLVACVVLWVASSDRVGWWSWERVQTVFAWLSV